MRRQFSLLCVLIALPLTWGCRGTVPPVEAPSADSLPEELSGDPEQLLPLSDAALIDLFEREFRRQNTPLIGRSSLDLCLWEMVRRGGSAHSDAVRRALDEIECILQANEIQLEDDSETRTRKIVRTIRERDLELLAALRRLEGKRDPLSIELQGPRDRIVVFPALPAVELTARNADPEGSTFIYTRGGDYRTGRWARWRFEVQDAEGRIMPIIERMGSLGGGMFSRDPLKAGQSWTARLHMGSFVQPLPPGSYRTRAQYSDNHCISEETDVRGSIYFQSEPFTITVCSPEIRLTADDRRQIRDWISQLAEAGPLKMLEGNYREDDYDFIPPDSAPGKLLRMGWKAVPDLIDALSQKHRPEAKAWMLSILFTATGLVDPRSRTSEGSALGPCAHRKAAWSLFDPSAGGVLHATRDDSADEGRLRPELQAELARKWRELRKHLTVTVP